MLPKLATALIVAAAAASDARAQTATAASLLNDGYKVVSTTTYNQKLLVFFQKDKSVVACDVAVLAGQYRTGDCLLVR